MSIKLSTLSILLSLLVYGSEGNISNGFSIKEATIDDIQLAFNKNQLSSRQLVELYLKEIQRLNPLLRGVIEVNPDALYESDMADQGRKAKSHESLPILHGIPILLKDNIATKDKLNTTAGSYALLGSIVRSDAGVVVKLRQAGAIILGKASLSEWSGSRSYKSLAGFCGRSGQGRNPYVLSASPCGSSSGSGISVAANLAAVSLGTESDGSILCPSSVNSVVGIKPTVGLTSRSGVVPISPRQDTVGPMCRTVTDAVYVLDTIVGYDETDGATKAAIKYRPHGGYKKFLKPGGLKDKRLGIVRNPFFNFSAAGDDEFVFTRAFESHFQTLRHEGAVVIDEVAVTNISIILNPWESGEFDALLAQFKPTLNGYLKQLVKSPVRSLADVIAFNKKFSKLEKLKEYGQDFFEQAETFNMTKQKLKETLWKISEYSRNGIEEVMRKHKIDAIVTSGWGVSSVLAIGGYPGISVPAGYDSKGVPFGICFGGLKGSEPKLIEIAYGFERATRIRKPPSFKP